MISPGALESQSIQGPIFDTGRKVTMKAYLEMTPRRTAFSPKTFCFKSRTLAFPARPKPTTTIPEVLASVPDMLDWNLSFAGRAFTFWYNLSRRCGQKISGELLQNFKGSVHTAELRKLRIQRSLRLISVSIKHGLRTADYGLRTGYKIWTRYKTRTRKYGLGIKHGQGIKRGLRTGYKIANWF